MDKKFQLYYYVSGITVFIISFVVYLFTLEPSASMWDCGEFLGCANKLQISHPPGSPVHSLVGRVFALFSPSSSSVAFCVNLMSALASGLSVMFLCWTVILLLAKIPSLGGKKLQPSIFIGGASGALAFAFTDSFWFSAVEAEVYAFSSLLTAISFWCILKWDLAPRGEKGKWIVFICYLLGISVGVHLLNLLVVPAIVAFMFFRGQKVGWKGLFNVFFLSGAILFVLMFFFFQGIPSFSAFMELWAVNKVGLSRFSGYFLMISFIVLALMGLLFYFYRKKKEIAKIITVGVCFYLLGYSSYALIIIRSADNPAIDMGNVESPFAFESYAKREQYPKRPLLYGNSFTSPVMALKHRYSYEYFEGEYHKRELNPEYVFSSNTKSFFPRMASLEKQHVEPYKKWSKFKGREVKIPFGGIGNVRIPTFAENLRFFFRYQLGHMYLRYFMWNFSGKQNDIQGMGEVNYGNWITGLDFLDEQMYGDMSLLPSNLKNNKGNNKYFLLPLIIGIIGMIYHFKKSPSSFVPLLVLFFMTGVAIVVYLNEIPIVPRERDYVYVGSFYVFSVWIGMGTMAFANMVAGKKIFVSLFGLLAPSLLLWQNYDDHDRSGRNGVFLHARNYLKSCEPNAIVFTNADNDTYPLWYLQEVEGIRKDVRVVLVPYLSANWYVNQLREPKDGRDGLKFFLGPKKFLENRMDYLPILNQIKSPVPLKDLLDFVSMDSSRAKVKLQSGKHTNYLPSRKISLKVPDRRIQEASNRFVKSVHIHPTIDFSMKGSGIGKHHLVLLDLIFSNYEERPIYFVSFSEPKELGIEKNLELCGYLYKLTPIVSEAESWTDIGFVDSDLLYSTLLKEFTWPEMKKGVYYDWTHRRYYSILNVRNKFVRLAGQLVAEGKKEKAVHTLDKLMEIMPSELFPVDPYLSGVAGLYAACGKVRKAEDLLLTLMNECESLCSYYRSVPKKRFLSLAKEYRYSLFIYDQLVKTADSYDLLPQRIGELRSALKKSLDWFRLTQGMGTP